MTQNSKKKKSLLTVSIIGVIVAILLVSCNKGTDTPGDTEYLEKFHLVNFEKPVTRLDSGKLVLFVDNSTCNALGQHSSFFQDVTNSLINNTKEYYSIKGSNIVKEDISKDGAVYSLLRNIKEVNYADLPTAAQKMAAANCESVLITDGEYYTPNIAKGHENDPYLEKPFKDWLLKGHDIHIISEPYTESNHGKQFQKKRFYIIFTDDRMENNIFYKISQTVDFKNYPGVDVFHISTNHPKLFGDGNNCSTQNSILGSKSFGKGTYEIEDWEDATWKNIEDLIVNAVDENTGEALRNGDMVISMGIDKNSFGCFRIKKLRLRAYNINQAYMDFYETKGKGAKEEYQLDECELEHFFLIDQTEFNKHSKVNIHFDKDYFDPSELDGKTYNYIKLDVEIDEIESIFDRHATNFEFESTTVPGQKNVSVASSIKQCLVDQDVLKMMKGQTIYSIYIKCDKYK